MSKNSSERPNTFPAEHPRLVKTQGTNQYVNIHCSLMDKSGNLWFGTTGEGVYRYDGKLFTQFTVKEGLSNNVVWSMAEDKAGNIWFGTDDGVSRYDGKTVTRVQISVTYDSNFYPGMSPSVTAVAKNEVWSIMEDKSGKLWFGTREGVYCYDGISFGSFLPNRSIINKDSLDLRMVACMLEDKKGNIWFGSGMPPGLEGVCFYDGKSITSFKPNGDGWVRYMIEDKSGNIWFGMRHQGIWRHDGKTFSKFTEGDQIGLSALADRSGNIWFSGVEKKDGYSSDGSLWCYDGRSLKKISVEGLGNYSVWSMVEDRSGNIWFGTRNMGLYRYDGKVFTSFSE